MSFGEKPSASNAVAMRAACGSLDAMPNTAFLAIVPPSLGSKGPRVRARVHCCSRRPFVPQPVHPLFLLGPLDPWTLGPSLSLLACNFQLTVDMLDAGDLLRRRHDLRLLGVVVDRTAQRHHAA